MKQIDVKAIVPYKVAVDDATPIAKFAASLGFAVPSI